MINERFYNWLLFDLINLNTKSRSSEIAEKHYDLGNDLFQAMMGKTNCLSCGYWRDDSTLDEAQINNMDLISKKLYLEPGMRVLDLGCGYGSLCKYIAENYDSGRSNDIERAT